MTSFKINILIILVILCLLISCAEEQPLSTTTITGNVVGIVKPFESNARLDLMQGKLVQTTYADTLSGYFEFKSVDAGVYNIDVSADNYGRRSMNEIIVYQGRTTSTPDIILKPLPEQILTINPANDATNISVTSSIEIQFSLQMNQSSVENNFSITPSVNGYFQWENKTEGSKLYFYPENQYTTSESYLFTLSKEAETIYGDTLSFDISSRFSTEGCKLISISPEDQSTFNSPQVAIYFTFNSSMARNSTENSIQFNPALLGDFKWLDSKRLSFQPGSYLETNTDHNISGLDQLYDVYGTYLSGKSSFTFRTEPLKISSNYPANGATQISRSTAIIVAFNSLVDQASVENAFTIIPSPANWSFQWTDLTRFQYAGTTPLSANTLYSVTIQDSTCTDYWGNILPSKFKLLFRTGE
ncbi:hypothetical protein B6I21_03770 [candidate division KSB1 bacterium 4572_119]|nr:MAG: hypothetical protein B6I21_03770 [candidate division KSB1 bacterium 4572_119]